MTIGVPQRVRDFIRPIAAGELLDLHQHTLNGIRAMAVCLAVIAPCGPVFVLAEQVHPARVAVALPLHLGLYALLASLAKRPFGWRHTNVLLASIPVPDPDVATAALEVIGEPPSPVLPPTGCRFHPRCQSATEVCTTTEPQLRELGPGHFIACHHPVSDSPVAVDVRVAPATSTSPPEPAATT